RGGRDCVGKLVASLWYQGIGRRMYDPGGIEENSDEFVVGDWLFEENNCDEKNTNKEEESKLESEKKALEMVKLKEVEKGGKEDLGVKKERIVKAKVLGTTALTRNKAQLFPTSRRPVNREILDESIVSTADINTWFESTSLHLGASLNGNEVAKARRMLYTWRDVFETDLLRIRQTDLIEHAIILTPGAKPHRARIPLYTEEEIAFCRTIIPKMEE